MNSIINDESINSQMNLDMNMRDEILFTLAEATEGLQLLKGDFYIIGSSAIILSGIDIGLTHDIDIFTSTQSSDLLQSVWKDKLIHNPTVKDSDLFKSNFACFQFTKLQVEAQGDLKIHKNDKWIPLKVNDFQTLNLNGLDVKIPTLPELIRILKIFGRDKDLRRIKSIEEYIQKR